MAATPSSSPAERRDGAAAAERLRLLIVRHGEPAYPADALTSRGRLQAAAAGDWLARRGVDRLYSSPMGRALETAEVVAGRLGLPVEVEEWTAELEDWVQTDPVRGEAPAWEIAPPALRGLEELSWRNWQRSTPAADGRPAAGFAELEARSDEFLARQGCERRGDRYQVGPAPPRSAVVCHCGFALTWLAHLLAVPPPFLWAGFHLPAGSITTVEFQPLPDGGHAARCLGLGVRPAAG